METSNETEIKYHCEACNYKCLYQAHWKQHLDCEKHKNNGTRKPRKDKKLEPQFHQREDVLMHQENSKVKGAMANRKGTRNIFRSSRRA